MKFSIIVPSLNQGQFLEQTLDSVISQSGRFELELIVMDGGSTDNSVQILEACEKKLRMSSDIIFYWQSKKDGGQAAAINKGIRKSTGDVIAYINSDDYYLPKAFDWVEKYFTLHPEKEWLVGNCQISDPNLSWTFFLKHLWPIQYWRNALLIFNTVNQPSVFVKKSLVKKVGYFNENFSYAFDYDYWLRCNAKTLPGRLFKYLAVFRVHLGSKGNSNYFKQFEEDWKIFISQHPVSPYFFAHALAKDFVNFVYKYLK